jgi:hypothetical protein
VSDGAKPALENNVGVFGILVVFTKTGWQSGRSSIVRFAYGTLLVCGIHLGPP